MSFVIVLVNMLAMQEMLFLDYLDRIFWQQNKIGTVAI
jgi:hypothetical protein